MKLLSLFSENESRTRRSCLMEGDSRSVGTNTHNDVRNEYLTDTEVVLKNQKKQRRGSPTFSLRKSLKRRFSFRSSSAAENRALNRDQSKSLPPSCRSKKSNGVGGHIYENISSAEHPCDDEDAADIRSIVSERESWISDNFSEITLKELAKSFSSSSSTLEGDPLYSSGNFRPPSQIQRHLADGEWSGRNSSVSQRGYLSPSGTLRSDETLTSSLCHFRSLEVSPFQRPAAPVPSSGASVTSSLRTPSANRANYASIPLQCGLDHGCPNALQLAEAIQHSPTSSGGNSGSADSGVETYESTSHPCSSCKMIFPNRDSLQKHWAASYEDEPTELPSRVFGKPGCHRYAVGAASLTDVETTPDIPRHIFKVKNVKKGRPCHVCHQPVLKIGSCCRVCKYLVHKACEPKNNNEATAPVKQQTISSRNTQSAARTHQTMSTEGSQALGGNKMDLVYVTERIISLVFPPGMKEAGYTLHLREVAHMLSSKHGDTFRVFDISLGGEVSHYLPRVTSLGWANGLAPPLEKLCSICKALDSWLNQHASHIAVLHSRNGYEKMGVVIAAYMHYSNICASTDQALDRYAMKRFFDDKIGHLFHPSQKRYVQYFAGLLSGVIRINSSPLYLHTLTLYGVPHFEPRGGCHLFIKIYQGMTPVYTSGVYNLTETMRQVTIAFESGVQLRGDILLKAYHRRLTPASREVIFRVQFHTCAVSDRVLPFARQQLDDACNDLRFPLDGGIELLFSQYPEDRPGIVSNVSCDKAPCDIAAWDSYENISAQGLLDDQEEAQSVNHTLGPLDGSLYATVSKRRSTTSPHSPTGPSPSPHGPNGRYAASIDSGIASSNSAGAAPISPPTSDTSRASGDAGGTAPVAAPTSRPGSSSVSGKSRVDARQLDELLAGMLLDIQSIPDLRPCQTPAPDIDSIRCPDFSSSDHEQRIESRKQSIRMEIAPPKQYSGVRSPSPMSPVNGYSGSSQNSFMCDDNVPYHARTDSKPFSYGAVTSSPLLNRHRSTSEGTGFEGTSQPPPSPSIHRRNSRETLSTSRVGLESPRLVRRMSGSVGASPADGYRHHSRSPSPSPEPGSRGGTLKRERSNTMTTRIMTGDASPTDTLGRSTLTRSASRLDDATDGSFSHDSFSRSYSSGASTNSSWLQMQQRKLQERRDAKHRSEKGPQEAKMFSELRSRIMQHHHGGRELEDGYISDTTHFSETSRESSPLKTLAPLTINTSASSPPKSHVVYSTSSKGNSAPSSPILTNRGTSSTTSTTTRQQAHYSNTMKGISRRTSDASHDRERPFMAVKRAHENSRGIDTVDSSNAFSQLQTSPLGHINYSLYNNSTANSTSGGQNDGLLTTTTHTAASQSGDESAWQSDTDTLGTNRPITPAFPPATPTTPYLNQGLPPKSPTAIRKELGGLRSPSPATNHYNRQELNGHSSPAPSLYHGQSRRSSLTSLHDSIEVISSHPKFVKDISKFWYKPNISRDDAISMLRDKLPGTFVVRDSNSFPGAFGLALKVSTPPPNVASKSSDPSNELVRHFLIEPTSRGVRLKGCANEPVFGSLSALVYQHSITALALPCRLTLPDRDPAGIQETPIGGTSTGSKTDTNQLLQQGAACNVLYLYSADTESLTGPQAVKRAIQLMLAAKPTPTVVHFKVSSQGITLTDSSRQLFFRRHYPVNTISHCGLDSEDRRWAQKNENGEPVGSLRMFGFVAKKGASRTDNQCHIIAELEPEQPATAICNFVTKVMMTSVNRSNLV